MFADYRAPRARILSRAWHLLLVCGLVALVALAPTATAESSGVVLNEVNCVGTDWVEVVNTGSASVSLANWLLTDDPINASPPRDTHRMRFGPGVVLTPGARLVVTRDVDFPFGLSCGDDTLHLANAADTLVDEVTLPVLTTAGTTYGRIPDGTGSWTWTLPTSGTSNATAPDTSSEDPAWLYDPLQVTEIDLQATPEALAQLAAVPDEYVEARITLRNGANTYGPYIVGLRLKGHSAFRTLSHKAAFKVKFGFAVTGQHFFGLKGLTLNNMVQDPSMISESTAALLLRATGDPAARVGYAYVRLNGADYGLYADVETIDAIMAQRWFASTQHVYEGSVGMDVFPGREAEMEVDEGSTTDISDLVALSAANAGPAAGWWERMQPVADMAEMTRVFAAEHYLGHWDSYSVSSMPHKPNNYYLHSDLAGRFSMIASGTDQTWVEHSWFGVYGDGVLMRGCIANATCQQLYVDALRQIAASPEVAALPAEARAIRAVVAPWRGLDPRREDSIAAGEGQAGEKIAMIEGRPGELAAWLADPYFADAKLLVGPSGVPATDLNVTGTVEPASSPVGGSHIWRLQVRNAGGGTASGAVLDVQVSPNAVVGLSQVTRGTGCVPAGVGALHCALDYLAPAGGTGSVADVVIGTNVTGAGAVTLTATASYAGPDPTADNTIVLTANVPAPVATPPVVALRPVLGKVVTSPPKPVAGKRFTFSLNVTRSDTGAPVSSGKMACAPWLAGKILAHTDSFKADKVRLSLVVPTTAKGKQLKIKLTVTAAGRAVARTFTYRVR